MNWEDLIKPSRWFYISIWFKENNKTYFEVYEALEDSPDYWNNTNVVKWIKTNYSNLIYRNTKIVYRLSLMEYDPEDATKE